MLVLTFVVWIFHPTFERCSLDSYDASTTALDLKNCKLTELSSSISKFTDLRKLDLGNNALSMLPDALPPSLETLFCSARAFHVPEARQRGSIVAHRLIILSVRKISF